MKRVKPVVPLTVKVDNPQAKRRRWSEVGTADTLLEHDLSLSFWNGSGALLPPASVKMPSLCPLAQPIRVAKLESTSAISTINGDLLTTDRGLSNSDAPAHDPRSKCLDEIIALLDAAMLDLAQPQRSRSQVIVKD
jgi:hypothetical protein